MEELASALTRAGISDLKLFKIRSSNYYIAVEGEKLVTEEQGEDPLVKAREDEDLLKSEKDSRCCSRRVVHSVRAARPSDNRFLYVVEGRGGRLRLRLGHTDPRHEGLGLFWKMEKFCESRLDFVYTFTNLKYNKSIGVKIEPNPTVTLLSPPSSPVCGPDPRVFAEKMTSRHANFLLQPTVCPGLYLAYNDRGDVTLSKYGSPFTERYGTPVCIAENDRTDGLWNLSGQPRERIRSQIVCEYSE